MDSMNRHDMKILYRLIKSILECDTCISIDHVIYLQNKHGKHESAKLSRSSPRSASGESPTKCRPEVSCPVLQFFAVGYRSVQNNAHREYIERSFGHGHSSGFGNGVDVQGRCQRKGLLLRRCATEGHQGRFLLCCQFLFLVYE